MLPEVDSWWWVAARVFGYGLSAAIVVAGVYFAIRGFS